MSAELATTVLANGHETGDDLAAAGDVDLLANDHAFEQAGEVRLRLVDANDGG